MGIQINGQTDTVSSTTSGGKVTITPFNGNVGTGASISSPATNVLTLGTNSVERVRVDSSGSLGIGTVPKTWTSGYNVLQVGSASLVGQSEQDGQTTNWSNNAYFDTNDNRWEYSFADQASQITQSDGLIIFKTASTGTANAALSWTESARFNTSGNLAFPSGQGIDFSATANSSGTMTSELLSDYEEGTFTVTPNTNLTLDSSYTTWFYTKIGRQVTISGLFRVSSVSGTNGVTGSLPFVSATSPANGTGAYAGGTMSTGVDIGDAGMAWYIAGGGANAFTFYRIYDNGGWDQLPNSALAPADEIYATMTYFTN